MTTQANLTITVRNVGGKASVMDIKGEVNSFAENALMDAYAQASIGNTESIILNFTDLEYMNSSGIGLLVTLLIRAKRQGLRLIAFGLSQHYQQIFELTRLNEAIPICETEAEGLALANSA